jgi:hypothetical protein
MMLIKTTTRGKCNKINKKSTMLGKTILEVVHEIGGIDDVTMR